MPDDTCGRNLYVLSLTPGFSQVSMKRRHLAVLTALTNTKPLKRLNSASVRNTGLKSGVNKQ